MNWPSIKLKFVNLLLNKLFSGIFWVNSIVTYSKLVIHQKTQRCIWWPPLLVSTLTSSSSPPLLSSWSVWWQLSCHASSLSFQVKCSFRCEKCLEVRAKMIFIAYNKQNLIRMQSNDFKRFQAPTALLLRPPFPYSPPYPPPHPWTSPLPFPWAHPRWRRPWTWERK